MPTYQDLEFKTNPRAFVHHNSPDDLTEMMRIAVETNDKKWFNQLCMQRNKLVEAQETIKNIIGWKEV